MQRGCISSIIYFGLIAGVYYLVVRLFTQVPFGIDLLLAGLCALFTGLFITSFFTIGAGRRDEAALRRAEKGEALQDGRMEAAIGAIQPSGQPLVSPFQRMDCAAYFYKISHREVRQNPREGSSSLETTLVTDFSGYALAPSTIQDRRGAVHLLALTNLDNFGRRIEQGRAAQNAREYLEKTPFEKVHLLNTFSIVSQVITENSGVVRKDWQIMDAGLRDDSLFEEQAAGVGQKVTALGYYSAARGGFVTHSSWNFTEEITTRLFNGDGKAARKELRVDKLAGFAFTLIGFIFLHVILVLAIIRS